MIRLHSRRAFSRSRPFRAAPLEMALFVGACLENLGLHPVLILGEKEIACGVWLYDSCFMDTVSDDLQRLGKYIADGINNLSCFDVNDLFSDKNVAYSTSEAHFVQKLNAGNYYDKYVDIRRCRIAHLLPLPLRARNLKGYEILSEEDMSPDAAPPGRRRWRTSWTWSERGLKSCLRKISTTTTDGEARP